MIFKNIIDFIQFQWKWCDEIGSTLTFLQINGRTILFIYCYLLTNNKNKKFRGFSKKKFVDFQNFQKSNFDGGKFLKIWSSINLPWGQRDPTKNLGPITSAVLTLNQKSENIRIFNKSFNKQTLGGKKLYKVNTKLSS